MRAQIDQQLRKSLADFAAGHELDDSIDLNPQLERTRDPRHGDFTTNIALRLAKPLGRPPRELAVELADLIPESTLIADVNVAGPGFINLTVASDAYLRGLSDLIEAGESYGRSDWGGGRRVIVEYVSANPTGPLHVGHGRHAAYGASLANLLRATGHEVHEEYYVNDAGRQMD
ncbi:MAG: arginine--tRNA ligase, partial [Rhodospirillaceae bacterium]|nr:arginine--tRNA ligase [Rhodospirillaceae bacterium]